LPASTASSDVVPFLEAASWSPFTTIVASASGSPGENPSFDLGRSGRRWRTCRFPLGGDALEVWSSSVRGGSDCFAGSSSARRVRGLGAGEEVGAAAPECNAVECRIWSRGRQRRQLRWSAASGSAGKSERRLRRAPLCCGVSVLVAWTAESSARVECGLGADVCAFLWFVCRSGGSGSCGGVATLVVWATGKSAR
jgi:hypothetical protein